MRSANHSNSWLDYTFTEIPFVLQLAFKRGLGGNTFATHDELKAAGYSRAYALGSEYGRHERVVEPHTLTGCGCPRCRLERIAKEAGHA